MIKNKPACYCRRAWFLKNTVLSFVLDFCAYFRDSLYVLYHVVPQGVSLVSCKCLP